MSGGYDMRIHNSDLSGNQTAQTGKTDQAQEIARLAESKVRDTRVVGADRVELSDLTSGLARALKAGARLREERVERLAADYAAGRHKVDAMAVSKAMVAEMRASGKPAA